MDGSVYWIIHILMVSVAVYSAFDPAIISVGIIVSIFCNLGNSSSGISAYSVFNKGCRYLLGDSRAEDVDKQLRGGAGALSSTPREKTHVPANFTDIPSKYINRPCPCGSGLKAKKCHGNRGGLSKGISTHRESAAMRDDYDFSGFEVVER